jgi:hypothetical protein
MILLFESTRKLVPQKIFYTFTVVSPNNDRGDDDERRRDRMVVGGSRGNQVYSVPVCVCVCVCVYFVCCLPTKLK